MRMSVHACVSVCLYVCVSACVHSSVCMYCSYVWEPEDGLGCHSSAPPTFLFVCAVLCFEAGSLSAGKLDLVASEPSDLSVPATPALDEKCVTPCPPFFF